MKSKSSPGGTFSPEDKLKRSVMDEHFLPCTQSSVAVLSLHKKSSEIFISSDTN